MTVRWPEEIEGVLKQRARARCRSLSAEVRELLIYARNTIAPEAMVSIASYGNCRSTSVSITPRLRNWLFGRAQYNDRTIQVEILSLITFALDHIMERDLETLAHLVADQEAHAPG